MSHLVEELSDETRKLLFSRIAKTSREKYSREVDQVLVHQHLGCYLDGQVVDRRTVVVYQPPQG